MSFFGWLILAYVGWVILSAFRKAAGQQAARSSGALTREEARQRLLEALGAAQGQRTVEPVSRPASRVAVTARRVSARPASTVQGPVDYDDQAAAVIRERRREVEVRNRSLAGDDHDAFDERVRREDADDAGGGPTVASGAIRRLRTLMVWQEILGPPVGLRDD